MTWTLMDSRPGGAGAAVREECPGNEANQLGLSREHKTGAIRLRGEVLTCQTEYELEGSRKPLATFDCGRDVLGRVTWRLCWQTGLQGAERLVWKVLQLSRTFLEWPVTGI